MISLHPFTSVSVIQRIRDSDVAYSPAEHLVDVRSYVSSVLSVWPTMSILIIHFCNAIPLISISISHIHHISLLLIAAPGAKVNLKWKLNSNAVFENIWSTKALLKLPDWTLSSIRADRISTADHFKLGSGLEAKTPIIPGVRPRNLILQPFLHQPHQTKLPDDKRTNSTRKKTHS